MSDRTVHASWDGMEVVRYDRSGKWYLESGSYRQRVSVRQAAAYAIWAHDEKNGGIDPGLPGGAAFDRLVAVLGRDSTEREQ